MMRIFINHSNYNMYASMNVSQPSIFAFLTLISIIITSAAGTTITRHTLLPGDVIGDLSYNDALITNGGELSINKNTGFDSGNQNKGEYNLQTEKVLTYMSKNGAHLSGEEYYILDISGSYTPRLDESIHCVYTNHEDSWLPAFCTVVQSRASLINVQSAQISESGGVRMVGKEMIPAELSYRMAVTPDAHSGISAQGTYKTGFSGSIMEARDDSVRVAATNQWKDASEVSGSITNFQKKFEYTSGFRI